MSLLSIIGVLLIGVASGLRNCNDCTEITQCREALNRATIDKSEETRKMLLKAFCGYMKVCCSDFDLIISRSNAGEGNEINNEDDIENHPNAYLLPDDCGTMEGGRIVGGVRAKMNEFPWLALIFYKINGENKFNCGGTVINENYVLTAAHCIKGKKIVGVRIGEYDIRTRTDCTGSGSFRTCQSNLQDVRVSKAIIHPHYTRYPMILNDIGLLRLDKPLNLTVANAGASCLPVLRSLRKMDIANETGVVAGWGSIDNRKPPHVLLKVDVPIYDKVTCNKFYASKKNSKTDGGQFSTAFCAGESRHDTCGGDSGGPIMFQAPYKNGNYQLIQFGIVSYGPTLCGTQIPGVYTEVKQFMKWILDTIEP